MENRDQIKSAFPWDSSYIYPVCASLFADRSMSVDPQRLKACEELLKEKTNIFSNYRGIVKLALLSMLAVDNSPELKLEHSLQVYDILKKHFFTSEYLPIASMIITERVAPAQYHTVAARTKHIYQLMRQEHPFLTSNSDCLFAALLALSTHTDEDIVHESEYCYDRLKSTFFSADAVQSLSHVLALNEGPGDEECQRTIDLYRLLKSRHCVYGTGHELATLGVLALLPAPLETIADDLLEVDAFLSKQKGYGFFGMTRTQRLMHAAMLVSSDYIHHPPQNVVMPTVALNSTLAIIISQSAAMCASLVAVAAANNNSAT
ncbi:MAG: DUF4003 domain-containing protein [Firmicutes bacterium]|nr:DUF4003 domain-containing protein [Bacillota bacterium]